MDVRCGNGILFFRIVEVQGLSVVEVKCRSARCGAGPGVVLVHRFTFAGQLHSSQQYRDPVAAKEVNT